MVVENRISQYLSAKGIRRNFIAKKAGIERGVFDNIFLGRREMRVDEFEAVCMALEVSPLLFLNYVTVTQEGKIGYNECPYATQGYVESQGN